jgi:hypothetical protein
MGWCYPQLAFKKIIREGGVGSRGVDAEMRAVTWRLGYLIEKTALKKRRKKFP